MRVWIVASVLTLCGCTVAATMTPMNEAAQALGAPQVQFQKGLSTGSVKIVMPDGEVLTGSFSVATGGGFATAFGAGGSASAVGVSAGGNFFASATGPHQSIVCRGNVSFGHGGGTCRTVQGAEYQVQF